MQGRRAAAAGAAMAAPLLGQFFLFFNQLVITFRVFFSYKLLCWVKQ